MMNKEGHLGVVKNTSIPIIKTGAIGDDGEFTEDETISRNSPIKRS
jgi:hypothetical protein